MSLTTNKFYQLRNLTAEVKNENGDFKQKLKEPIRLEEGDQIIMNKAILDTRSVDSGKIVLENDTTFTINFNQYRRFNSLDGAFEFREPASSTKLTSASIDADPYIFCTKNSHSSVVYRLTQIELLSNKAPPLTPFTLDIEYTAVDNTTKLAHIRMIPQTNSGLWKASNLDLLAINSGAGTEPNKLFRLTDKGKAEIEAVGGDVFSYDPDVNEDPSTNTCVPVKLSHSCVIPKGAYDPDDIAERISVGMTEIQSGTTFDEYPVSQNNLLLGTTEDTYYTAFNNRVWINMFQDPATTPPENMMAFENQTGPNQAYLRGTSQFALEFEEETQRFKFSYLHFPLYKSGANDIVSRFIGYRGSAVEARLTSAEGGILLESLQSVDNETNVELGIWEKSFGFNIHELCPQPRYIDNTALVSQIPRYVEDGSVGTYFTQGESNIDVGVVKAQGIKAQGAVGLETIISADQTESIFAKSNFGQINLSSGYFMIEINGLYNDGLITNTDLKNHIFAIVGRYYENENYTTGTEQDAIVYQHKGATQYLNQFSIRVLDSNYNLAQGIGDDNTIFLQHIKATAITQPEKK